MDKALVIGYTIRHKTRKVPSVAEQLLNIQHYVAQHDDLEFDPNEMLIVETVAIKDPPMMRRAGTSYIVAQAPAGSHTVLGCYHCVYTPADIHKCVKLFTDRGLTFAVPDMGWVDTRYNKDATFQILESIHNLHKRTQGKINKPNSAPYGWAWNNHAKSGPQLAISPAERAVAVEIELLVRKYQDWSQVYAHTRLHPTRFTVRGWKGLAWQTMTNLWLAFCFGFPKIHPRDVPRCLIAKRLKKGHLPLDSDEVRKLYEERKEHIHRVSFTKPIEPYEYEHSLIDGLDKDTFTQDLEAIEAERERTDILKHTQRQLNKDIDTVEQVGYRLGKRKKREYHNPKVKPDSVSFEIPEE